MKTYTYARLTWTFWPWAYMMLGELARNLGILVGVTVFITIRTLIYTHKDVVTLIIPVSPETARIHSGWFNDSSYGVIQTARNNTGKTRADNTQNKILKIKEEVSKTS
ncbi:MAG: hypothetical protein QXV41_01360 [Zestosphaera sp.]